MDKIRGLKLSFVFILSFLFFGCEDRYIYDYYPQGNVKVSLDWSEDKGNNSYVKVIFFPKDSTKQTFVEYLPCDGGLINVPIGEYDVILHSYSSESIFLREGENYSLIEAFTKRINPYPGIKDFIIDEPDRLYTDKVENFCVTENKLNQELSLKPRNIVYYYTFKIEARKAQNISSISAIAKSFSHAHMLYNKNLSSEASSIYFEPYVLYDKTDAKRYIKGMFGTFGKSPLIEERNVIRFYFELSDEQMQIYEIDVTEEIGKKPYGGELDIEDVIIINDVKPTEGGFAGSVDDWQNEEEIELPLNK